MPAIFPQHPHRHIVLYLQGQSGLNVEGPLASAAGPPAGRGRGGRGQVARVLETTIDGHLEHEHAHWARAPEADVMRLDWVPAR